MGSAPVARDGGVEGREHPVRVRLLWHLALTRGRLDEADALFAEMAPLLKGAGAPDALARAHIREAEARRTLRADVERAAIGLNALLERADLDLLRAGASLGPRAAAALAAAGDTVRASRLLADWEALPPEHRANPDAFSPALARARADLAAGRPGRAIDRLRRASAGTIQALEYLPDLARAHRLAGQPDSAIATLERYLELRHTRRLHRVSSHLGPALAELAELYEADGDAARARASYARLVALWERADPELQPRVEHARRRLAALSGDER